MSNSAQHLHNDSLPVQSGQEKDGDLITFNTKGNKVDHVGFLVIDSKTNKKYIAESSAAYNRGTIIPLETRLDSLKKSYPNMEVSIRRLSESGGKDANLPNAPVKRAIDIVDNNNSYGKFSPAKDKNAPLVMVFGGIDRGKKKSGSYMYDYFNRTGDKYNLFVAKDHTVNGTSSYENVVSKAPNAKNKVLYLFSGGYKPGKQVLEKYGADSFTKIFLVDPWMGNADVGKFYADLAAKYPDKIEYYYTEKGAVNSSARDRIASSVKTKVQNKKDHFQTNEDAVNSLLKSIY